MSTRLLYVASFFAFLLSQVFAQKLQTVTIQGREAVADEVIVKLKPQNAMAKASRTAARENLLRQCGASVKTAWMTGSELWKVQRQDLERVLELLKKNPLVEYAYPNYISVRPAAISGKIPNDPGFGMQWHLLNTGQGGGTAGADISATEAWNITTGDSTIVVAILDSGVDTDHPDLKANVWKNKNEIPGNGLDDDNNGFIDDVYGWDFIANDNAPLAHNYYHGTACAGLIAAVQDNGIGISGVAPRVKIMILRVMEPTGGPISASVSAMEYAIKNGAKILNCSLAGGSSDSATDEMLRQVNDHGLLVVAAAGNNHADLDRGTICFPAQYNYPNIVAVANSDSRDCLSSTSNFGQCEVDVAAPGELVYTTTFGGSYFAYSGTSFSAPIVSGVAALVWSLFPTLTAEQVRQQLILSSDPVPSLYTYSNSCGRVNAYRAVRGLYLSPLTMKTKSLDFGAVKLNTPNLAKSVWIKNSSNDALVVDSLVLGSGFSFSATDTAMKKSSAINIGARDSISVNVFFNPSVEQSYVVPLIMYDLNSYGQTVTMIAVLQGRGVSTGTIIDAATVSGTWTKAASPYIINNSVEVRNSLTIEPGTLVKFGPGREMSVLQGARLLARGTELDSIHFTAALLAEGWEGLTIASSGNDDELSHCVVSGTRRTVRGSFPYQDRGALTMYDSSPTVTHTTIRDNTSPFPGTAMLVHGSSKPRIDHILITRNSGTSGTALVCYAPGVRFNNIVISENISSYTFLIGIFARDVTFNNVLASNNTVQSCGLFTVYENATFNNCTITKNLLLCQVYGGGIFEHYEMSKMTIRNSIVWDNSDGSLGYGTVLFAQGGIPSRLTVQIINSDIDTTGRYWKHRAGSTLILADVSWAGQNLVGNPLFADPPRGDFTLSNQSPCINAGTADTTSLSLPVSDLNGNYRIAGGRIDMGAYEFGSGNVPAVLPPSPPVLAAPVDGAASLQASPILSWNSVGGATSYHLQVSTSTSFGATIVNDSTIVVTSKSIGPLSLNTTYYWRVRSKNEGGTSAWSATRSFTTAVAVPSAPTLAGPADSSINVQLTTALRWSVSAGATLYHLQVSTASGFTAFVVNDSTVSDTSKSVGPLSLATTYYWRVRAKNEGGWGAYSSARQFSTIRTTEVEQLEKGIPTEYSLSQNFPNPFNPTTMLRFGIPNAGFATLKVFDLLGREIETLAEEELAPGYYQVRWKANVPSGIYFYRLQAGAFVAAKKMVLLK